MASHEESLCRLNYMGKAHLGKEYTHGRVMTGVDDSKHLVFQFGPGYFGCLICQRLYYAALKVRTEAEIEQLLFRVKHPEAGSSKVER